VPRSRAAGHFTPIYLLVKFYYRKEPHWKFIVPFILISIPWAVGIHTVTAFFIFFIPITRKRLSTLNLGCLLIIAGVWIEKGPGFVVPGFVPDPLGEIYEYIPNLLELVVSFGIWAVGFLIFTLLMKVAIPIASGEFSHSKYEKQ